MSAPTPAPASHDPILEKLDFDCRFCGTKLRHRFVDLGIQPLCESYVALEDYHKMEPFYPLEVYVCDQCFLVQLDEFVPAEDIFTEYAYFSSYATSWVEHAKKYAHLMVERFGFDASSQVVELASNDGYLLQHFRDLGIPNYGIEPAANVAKKAEEIGIETIVEFFGVESAQKLAGAGRKADLLLGNNVLAQVPDLNDFVGGMKVLLAEGGVITMEFPHVLRLMRENQFDTIYHEHFGYFSWITVEKVFAHHGIRLFDVDEIPTHGGSLRIYGCHDDDTTKTEGANVAKVRRDELEAGLDSMAAYADFEEQVKETKRKVLDFLIEENRAGRHVAAYGAPGKGNTLLNYCGVRSDMIAYTCDRNPYKQGRFLPGTRIPIHPPERLAETKPDTIVIMPWNFEDEIVQQLAYTREWGARLVVFIPEVKVLD